MFHKQEKEARRSAFSLLADCCIICYIVRLALACSTNFIKAGLSNTAISDNTFRSTSMAAFFKPFMNTLYDKPHSRAAALIRAIHNARTGAFSDGDLGRHIAPLSSPLPLQCDRHFCGVRDSLSPDPILSYGGREPLHHVLLLAW